MTGLFLCPFAWRGKPLQGFCPKDKREKIWDILQECFDG